MCRSRLSTILPLLLFSSLSCTPSLKESPESNANSEKDVVVLTDNQVTQAGFSTAIAAVRTASATLSLPGTLEVDPRRSWRVSPVVQGVVEEIGAVSHDRVKKGQMLARLRSTALGEAEVAWLAARSALRLATADRERNVALRSGGVVSESQWLRVESEFQRAQASLAQAERELELAGLTPQQMEALGSSQRRLGELTLVSPANGVVLASTVSRGQLLGAGDDAYQIADLSTLWVTVHIPVGSLAQVAPGANCTVRVAGSPREGWRGRLGLPGGKVDANHQTVEGRVIISSDGKFLRPGMFAQVEVAGTPQKALMVPTAAVFTIGNQAYVFRRLQTTRFRPVAVTAAPPLGEWTPVSGPELEAGAELVVRGLAELKSHWLYSGGE